MKRGIFVLASVLILTIIASCSPNGGNNLIVIGQHEQKLTNDQVLDGISVSGLLQDIFNGNDGITTTWSNVPPRVITLSSSTPVEKDTSAVYATISFDDYRGHGIENSKLCIDSGEMIFTFLLSDVTGMDVDGAYVPNSGTITSFSSYVSKDIVIFQDRTGSLFTISSIEGIRGTAISNNIEITKQDDGNYALSSGFNASDFKINEELSGTVNSEPIGSGLTVEDIAKMIDPDQWVKLLIPNNRTDYSVENDASAKTLTISFNGFKGKDGIIKSGKISYSYEVSEFYGMLYPSLDGYTLKTISIPKTDPIVIMPYGNTDEFTVSLESNEFSGAAFTGKGVELPNGIISAYATNYYSSGTYIINGEAIAYPNSIFKSLDELGIDGKGTQNDPYRIATAAQLRGLAQLVNNTLIETEGKHFRLENDIDLENIPWTPIGSTDSTNSMDLYDPPETEPGETVPIAVGGIFPDFQRIRDKNVPSSFKGHFDGNGKTISNLSIQLGTHDTEMIPGESSYAGLFGVIGSNATIKNLTINNADISMDQFGGAFAGYILSSDSDNPTDQVVLENLKLTGDIEIVGRSNIGGIVGRCSYATNLVMRNCSVSGNAGSYIGDKSDLSIYQSSTFVGGIIGCAYSNDGTTIENCNVSGTTISGRREIVGGLAGHFNGGSISGASISNVDLAISTNSNTSEYKDNTDALGALLGSISTDVKLSGISFNDVSLDFPTESTELNYFGVIGRYRTNNIDNTDIGTKISGQTFDSNPEGVTIQ